MKPLPDETYETWCGRVRMYENGHAMMRIAQGDNVDEVMESMARRIMDKLLHPLYLAIRESANTTVDMEELKRGYTEKMERRGPVADHVEVDT
jgi:glutamyl-tRNA reductase